MKHWIIWVMLAAVLLTGCTGNNAADTTSPTIQTTAPDPGLYVSESAVEEQTGGAVRQYALEQDGFCAMDFMGSDVLMFFEREDGVLVNRLTGINCSVAASGVLPAEVYSNGTSVRAEGRMLAYYNAADNSIVYLNESIQESGRRQLPHAVSGIPVLGRDLYTAYYKVGMEVFAADLRAGIARLVRQYNVQAPAIQQTLFDDSMLLCAKEKSGDSADFTFISALVGSPMGTDSTLNWIATCNDNYLLSRRDGIVEEILVGVKDDSPKLLTPKEEGSCYPVLSMNGAVVASVPQNGGIQLAFYDLSTGRRTSEVMLPSLSQLLALESDDSGKYVWLVACDSTGKEMLFRWDVAVSANGDQTEYIRQRYTLEKPDTEGLTPCRTLAEDISKRHGVNVTILDDIKQPEGYRLNYEYQVKAVEQGLKTLDAVLSGFPEGFFVAMKTISGDKGIHIGLVRSVVGNTPNTVAEPEGLQYWLDGEAYIALSLNDDIEKSALHQLSHVLDTYIFTNSILYDEWDEVNPAKFRYDENYTDYLSRGESTYLREEDRCFIDSYAMTFAKEDRARILEYAMTEGNEAFFTSSVMQNKLLRVCRAIRDAYDWKKDTRTFSWEQYLNESLAYVEKKK